MYYIKNCLLDKLVFIAVMFILMFTVEKFTPTYLSDDLIQLVSLLITLIRIIIISSVVLISTVTILDLGYINRREFRDIADNCERRDRTNLISAVAKIAVMQKPGYTELEYNQIIDKVYNRKALDDRQDN